MPTIEARDLTIRYGELTAVDGLSMTAEAGEVLGLLGPNGAGKTSTVETLEGYRAPTAGTVRVLGLDPLADRRRVTPRIGVMLQQGGIYPGITPREALRLFAAYYDGAHQVDRLLERVGLDGVIHHDQQRPASRRHRTPAPGAHRPAVLPVRRIHDRD